MRKLGFVLLAVGSLVGCSDNDVTTTPTGNGVFPTSGFLGRKARVEISGDATTWSSAATVSFGDGVTVDMVTLASPTDLFADITIMPTAMPGLKDVTVTDGGKNYTLAQAFELKAPISVKFQGTVAQGSIPTFTIVNHDFDNPFDDTSMGDGFFTPITYPNVNISGPTGAAFQVSTVTPYKITGIVLIDVDAAPGTVDVQSGAPGGDITDSPLGANMAITARAPVALTSGTAATGQIVGAFDSQLFSISATAPMVTSMFALADDPNASPAVAVLGGNGHFQTDFLGFGPSMNQVSLQSGTFYLIYWDNTGSYGYGSTVKATNIALTATTEGSDTGNNASATAQPVTVPGIAKDASLSSLNDKDWFSFTVTSAMVGKHVHVTTVGDPYADTFVDVYTAVKVTQANGDLFNGNSADTNYQEDIDSAAIPASALGTKVYVRVTASQAGFFDPSHNAYNAAIFLD